MLYDSILAYGYGIAGWRNSHKPAINRVFLVDRFSKLTFS